MDTGYWNATLRIDQSEGLMIRPETIPVLSSGLLALSLTGNKLTGSKLHLIGRALRHNYWLLGLI